jgi:hypothetical protein
MKWRSFYGQYPSMHSPGAPALASTPNNEALRAGHNEDPMQDYGNDHAHL